MSGNQRGPIYFLLFLLVIVFSIRYVIYLVLPVCDVGKSYLQRISNYGDINVDENGVFTTEKAVVLLKDHSKRPRHGTSLVIGSCKGYLIKNFRKKIVLEDAIIHNGDGAIRDNDNYGFWDRFRFKMSSLILRSHSREVASMILGFVFGMKDQLGVELYELFKRAGISHVVVASGFNIALLAGLVSGLLFFLPKGYRILIVLICLLPYLFIVGFEPPILRSYIMLVVSYLGWFFGRGMSGGFVGAVVLMLMIDPTLIFNLSFLLSVGATFGLVYISTSLDVCISKIGLAKFLGPFKEELSTTLGAFVGVLPVSLLLLGSVSMWGIVVNVLVGPFVSLITVLSLIDSILMILHIPSGGMVSLVVEILIRLWLMLVRLLVK